MKLVIFSLAILLFLQYAAALEQFSDTPSDAAADVLANTRRIFSLADKPTDFVYMRTVAVPFNSKTGVGALTENAFFKISGRLNEIDPASNDLTRYSDRAFELLNGTVEWRFQQDSNDADPRCTRSITVNGNGKDFISDLDVVVDVNDGKDANGNVAHLDRYDLRLTYKKQGLSGKPEFALAGQILVPVDVTYVTAVHQLTAGIREVCDGSTESTTTTRKKSIPVQFPVTLLEFDTSKYSQSGELTASEPYGNEFEGKVTSISGAQEAKFTKFVTTTPVKILGNDGPWKVTWNIELPNAVDALENAIEGDSDHDGLTNVDETRYGTDSNNPDTDGDGLLDGWEVNGVYKNGNKAVDLPTMGSDPLKRDVFLEIDWMAANASHSHKPEAAAIQRVVNAFSAHDIRLHVDLGQNGGGNQVQEQPSAAWSEFKFINEDEKPRYLEKNKYLFDIKKLNFDPNRIGIFHYGIFVHERNDSSGQAEVGGNFFVALPTNDTIAATSGTLMHEFGHTLQLGHGGRFDRELQYDNIHFKPNYRSIMNYHFQLGGVPRLNTSTGELNYVLDYSQEKLADLNESGGLSEINGLASLDPNAVSFYACFDRGHGRNAWDRLDKKFNWSSNMIMWFVLNASPIDWDCDGNINASTAISVNGYNDRIYNNSGPYNVLTGRSDWDKIVLQIGCPAYGMASAITQDNQVKLGNMQGNCTELSDVRANLGLVAPEESEQLPPRYPFLGEACDGQDNDEDSRIDEGCSDRDRDGIIDDLDNCPTVANPNQLDSNRDFFGDACTETLQVATQSAASSTVPNSTDIDSRIDEGCSDRDGDGVVDDLDNCLVLSEENSNSPLSFLTNFPFEILGLIIAIVFVVGVLVVAGIAYLLLKK